MLEFVENDTGSVLRVTCVDNDTDAAINLTGATVRLRWRHHNGDVTSKTMNIVTAASGIVEYQFASGELWRGTRSFEVEIADAQGKVITSITRLVATVHKEFG